MQNSSRKASPSANTTEAEGVAHSPRTKALKRRSRELLDSSAAGGTVAWLVFLGKGPSLKGKVRLFWGLSLDPKKSTKHIKPTNSERDVPPKLGPTQVHQFGFATFAQASAAAAHDAPLRVHWPPSRKLPHDRWTRCLPAVPRSRPGRFGTKRWGDPIFFSDVVFLMVIFDDVLFCDFIMI